MTIHFFIKYQTHYGETLFITGNHEYLGSNQTARGVALSYYNEDFWRVQLTFPKESLKMLSYRYFVNDKNGIVVYEGEADRFVDLSETNLSTLNIIDTWTAAGDYKNVFYTPAFSKVLLPAPTPVPEQEVENYTHEFRVKSPLLAPGQTVVLYGSTPGLKKWNTEDPIFLQPRNNWFVARVHLADNEWPATYKYGIYNLEQQVLLGYEEGENRVLYKKQEGLTIFQDGYVNYYAKPWKGGGLAIPVFSLRSQAGWGVGEFSDIKLLVDWSAKAGLQLIQLLPVNDTIAQHNWSDSYPYSAVSAFALHPLYSNLDKVAGKEFASILKPYRKKQKELNQLPEVAYEQVMQLKLFLLRELFEKMKADFKDDKNYLAFFERNRTWLVPYAAFCYLRDKYKTPDFLKWKTHSTYKEGPVQKLVSPEEKHFTAILFYYFVQYHLHLQLKEAVDYAHESRIAVKGDLPIGIYRYSCDAWVSPSLYKMEEQAGAPPDDFAVKGQNWGFPTYNWRQMKEDDFSWWRRRFAQMNIYFDAFRIDHILGFFRIWSIPLEAVEGVLGRFVPALPVHVSEFEANQVNFDFDRFCRPFISNQLLDEWFAERKEEVSLKYLDIIGEDQYRLKDMVNTQRKIEALFKGKGEAALQQGLFDLVSNVLLLEEEGSERTRFHFRIAMENTPSFGQLESHTQQRLQEMYINYFYRRQEGFWRKNGLEKLPALKRSTNMLIFGEDLGMVPQCVPEVLQQLGILSLEIERMPKDPGTEFFHPKEAPYLSVVTPSTHDMSTLRGWWLENREKTQSFYNYMLGHYGEAPPTCEAWINKEIVIQHVYSPAIWCIFQLQDLLGIDEALRRSNPAEERINLPSDPHHQWKYRMHISLEDLINEKPFNEEIRKLMLVSGRLAFNEFSYKY